MRIYARSVGLHRELYRPGTTTATSIFQLPPSCRTTTSSQHARPSGVLRRRSDGLEYAAWRPPRPVAQCRQFPEKAKDASVSECTWTLSALEALRNLRLTYLLTLCRYLHSLVLHSDSRKAIELDSARWSFKVIKIGINQKPICDFLLVFSYIFYRFRDITIYLSNIFAVFTQPILN